jgi:Heterokaryon incompatibility protein (HET)
MRLLNVHTKTLQEFRREAIPNYLILSHTWAFDPHDEVLFQDIITKKYQKKGAWNTKLNGFCEEAKTRGYQWVWIDTCCIDKASSAELQEAINSMYQWYHRADMCLVHLTDVMIPLNPKILERTLGRPKWFSRGWTLQELVASRNVEFFDSSWRRIGARSELSLWIYRLTGIPHSVSKGYEDPRSYSLADRVAWAEGRETTRSEDLAYSLLGLLDISMPIIYGEGKVRAFRRLLREIEISKSAGKPLPDLSVSEFVKQLGGRTFKREYPQENNLSERLVGPIINPKNFRQNVFSSWKADSRGAMFLIFILVDHFIYRNSFQSSPFHVSVPKFFASHDINISRGSPYYFHHLHHLKHFGHAS